mgnify:CR=1 FL=1
MRLSPSVSIDVFDQNRDKLLLSRNVIGDEVLPTTQKSISQNLPVYLKEGQYWANMEIADCEGSKSLVTFSIVEKGTIADKGELIEIRNKPWALTNETVQIIAKFLNKGHRSVAARFKGTIKLDNKIVRLIETEEIIVPAGEIADFEIFFSPELPGKYVLAGKVIYNKKLTFEKGAILNVNPAETSVSTSKFSPVARFTPLAIYVIIGTLIVFVLRKIIREKFKNTSQRKR